MTEKKAEIEEGKSETVSWVNSQIKSKYLQIAHLEQLSTGVVFCELFNVLYPGKIPLSRVFIRPKGDFEVLENFKLLTTTFQKSGLRSM